jgi:hypothetical protein
MAQLVETMVNDLQSRDTQTTYATYDVCVDRDIWITSHFQHLFSQVHKDFWIIL